MSAMFTRYVKKSMVESPYITLTVVLSAVGVAMPTWVYYNGGREKEAAQRFDLLREMRTDPRRAMQIDENSSHEDKERQRKLSAAQWTAERRAAAGL